MRYFKGGKWNLLGDAVSSSMYPTPGVGYSIYQPNYNGAFFTVTFDQNLMWGHPRPVPQAVKVDEMGIYVQTGIASSTVRLGLYTMNENGQAQDLIVDAGTVDASTSGAKFVSISPAITIPAGMIYAAMAPQGANATVRSFVRSGCLPIPSPSNVFWGDTAHHQVFRTGVTGALPATFSQTGYTQTNVPAIWIKISEVL